ncbi:protein ENHANCED DISEASE RESISTANCE 2-like [Andrographis paniculata]|uniref:protein ENHANCED DISEASE RESISTANCE 2-like n=1 Tax=Andrographis paniculata TaxID=175694 RepID=UPI0021E88590|nr:protein ENHANCED DISEASE RESISTANCE 2-like [Andrographis paniculata]
MEGSGGRMEGWLYLIRYNRLGLQYSRKRYFVLEDNVLKSFKSVPNSESEEPVRSAIVDSWIRVVDNGREHHHRRLFFIFTLYNTSNHDDALKLGAASSEEAAKWILSLREAVAKPTENLTSSSRREYQPFRLSGSKRIAKMCSTDNLTSSRRVEAMTSDVLAPSPWKIFGCKNGLRLFKEAKDTDSNGKYWGDHPAVMAVGIVEGTSEAVFHTLMCLGNSRMEWDFCFYKGCVIEHLDGHTDIIHIQLYNHWLPWAMRRRDLLLQRYWRREDDGTYVILYHSVFHKWCPPRKGYVRACIKSGGYVITPTRQVKECVVKQMLAVDWGFWKFSLRQPYERSITIRMLETVAALSEFFKMKARNTSCELVSGDQPIDIGVPEAESEDKRTHTKPQDKVPIRLSGASSLSVLNDAEDEFFDVPEPSDNDISENGWPSDITPESCYMDNSPQKLSSAACFVKKLHDLAVQKKGYLDLQEVSRQESVLRCYGSTLPKDESCNMPCSWATSDASAFLVRGKNYLEDRLKIKATGTLMQFVAADWLKSDKREDDISGRDGGIIQKCAQRGGPEFFFVINIQVPGTSTYSLVLYYMLKSPLEETPLLERFVNGDDGFRNSRFKLIPYISKGSWIVKQSVGRKACLIGQALEINYFRGKNYIELGVDIGSSTVARGVVSLVLGYLGNLVIEMAFLIQGNSPEELPEFLLGTCRLNHLDATKSISTDSITNKSS